MRVARVWWRGARVCLVHEGQIVHAVRVGAHADRGAGALGRALRDWGRLNGYSVPQIDESGRVLL